MNKMQFLAHKFEMKMQKHSQDQTMGAAVHQQLTDLSAKLAKLVAVNQWVRQISSLQDLQALQNMINSNELKTKEEADRYMAMLDKDIRIISELPKYL